MCCCDDSTSDVPKRVAELITRHEYKRLALHSRKHDSPECWLVFKACNISTAFRKVEL